MIDSDIKPRAFLEQNEEGEWFEEFVYNSIFLLQERGFEIVPFVDRVDEYVNKHSDIIFAGVQATEDFFQKCCIPIPKYLGYPDSLKKYLHRDIKKIQVKNIKEFPIFIKPADNIKEFTGELIEKESSLQFMKDYMNVKDDMMVYTSEPIDFISEYRCFVYKNELKGIQYYQGDYREYICAKTAEKMIEDYKDEAPIAYSLDLGVTKYGTTLVEINDMWAIGSYGFDYKEYVKMCIDRMQEIKNK